jgi:aminopeptidase YwaD
VLQVLRTLAEVVAIKNLVMKKSFVGIFLVALTAFGFQNTQKNVSGTTALRFDSFLFGTQALDDARYFTQFWRIGGGPGFDSCVSYISRRLQLAGFSRGLPREPNSIGSMMVQEDPSSGPVWIPENAVLSLTNPLARVLHSYAQTPVLLCHNSFPQDLTAELVNLNGGSRAAEYENVDVKNKIVLCDVPPGPVFRQAIQHGARGVISSYVPPYNAPEKFPTNISEGSIPYDVQARSFGLKISLATAGELRRMLMNTKVSVRVQVQSSFAATPTKTLIAEIPGNTRPDQRIVLVAHLDHYRPGANDNASGSATLLEIARGIASGIQTGTLQPPGRTLTFLWVDEYRGTGFWMKRNELILKDVQAAFVLDMVGGNPATTGGMFRVERMPDPGVVWTRPPDQHSGWGAGQWPKEKLRGNYLNAFYLSIIRDRSEATGWKTTQNVWEGGSDHDPFLQRGIPAVLSWHFPDYGYHASMDSITNISPVEMQNAGVSIATASYLLASGDATIAERALSDVKAACDDRLTLLEGIARKELASARSKSTDALVSAISQEREIIDAWGRWYEEALRSVLSLPVSAPSDRLRATIVDEVRRLNQRVHAMEQVLGL